MYQGCRISLKSVCRRGACERVGGEKEGGREGERGGEGERKRERVRRGGEREGERRKEGGRGRGGMKSGTWEVADPDSSQGRVSGPSPLLLLCPHPPCLESGVPATTGHLLRPPGGAASG